MMNRKTTALKTVAIACAAVAALAGPLQSTALSGTCGAAKAEAKQASYTEKAETKAIYPLAEEAGFKTLTAAVKAAGLDGVLTEGGPFTVFAPTDEAFAKLPEGTVESLLADTEKLKKVLLYHVVSGSVTSDQVVQLASAETLNGESVSIDAADGVKINDARVIQADVGASNGTVHVIDTVLIPTNL